jgi:hypothetical protein
MTIGMADVVVGIDVTVCRISATLLPKRAGHVSVGSQAEVAQSELNVGSAPKSGRRNLIISCMRR